MTWFWEKNDKWSKVFMGKGSLCSWHWSPDARRAVDLEGNSSYQLLSVTCAWAGAAAARLHVTQTDQSPCVLCALERTACPALGFYELVLLARPCSLHPPLSAVSACLSLLLFPDSLLLSSHFSKWMQSEVQGQPWWLCNLGGGDLWPGVSHRLKRGWWKTA